MKKSLLKTSLFSLALGLASLISGAVQAETIEEIEARVDSRIRYQHVFSRGDELSFARDLATLFADSLKKRVDWLDAFPSFTQEDYRKMKRSLRACNNRIECLQEVHAPHGTPWQARAFQIAVVLGGGMGMYLGLEIAEYQFLKLTWRSMLGSVVTIASPLYAVFYSMFDPSGHLGSNKIDLFKKRIMKEMLRVLPELTAMPLVHQDLWLSSRLLPIDIPLGYFSDAKQLAKGYEIYRSWLVTLRNLSQNKNPKMHTQLLQLLDAAGRPGFWHKTKLERLIAGIAQVYRLVEENDMKSHFGRHLYDFFDGYRNPTRPQDTKITADEFLKRNLHFADADSKKYFQKNKGHFFTANILELLLANASTGKKIRFTAVTRQVHLDRKIKARFGEDVLLKLELVGGSSVELLAEVTFYHVPGSGLKEQADVLPSNLDQLFATATAVLSTSFQVTSSSHGASLDGPKGSLDDQGCADALKAAGAVKPLE